MLRRDARFIAAATNGQLVTGDNQSFSSVSIDTRTLSEGAAFFCIRGPRFDGHDFLASAIVGGASVVVVAKDASHKLPDELPSHLAVVTVDEPEQALQTSAQRWAESQDVFTIGLTGSSGKTSTKEMLAQILSVHAPVLATQGNLNNHLGVPLTLWSLTEEHRYAVVEMGMNAPGEISFLASLAQPNLGIVTTVGEAHTEGVGSLEGVARAKGELLRHLGAEHTAVFPSEVRYKSVLTDGVTARQLTVGPAPDDFVRILEHQDTEQGLVGTIEVDQEELTIELPVRGRHNLENAALATAVAVRLGLSKTLICEALKGVALPALRGELKELDTGSEVTLDCYNANPQSMRAAMSTFMGRHPQGLLVLGDMLELGDCAHQAHVALGRSFANDRHEHTLMAIGPLASSIVDGAREAGVGESSLLWFPNVAAALETIEQYTRRGQALLLKGSRGMKLEQIWTHLSENGGA
ncbi:MAG: UDP-N-acetylmuramoyl-tripeptide--D-alanyl-D-alanine ligase [Bradymonadia bacterium]